MDATVHYFSKEHLSFVITAILILFLPRIFYSCEAFSGCLNCCHKRKWHALHTFVEAYHGCYKNGVSEGWNFQSICGVYMLFRVVVVLVDYHVVNQIGWLLCAVVCLSLSIIIMIIQPYKMRHTAIVK